MHYIVVKATMNSLKKWSALFIFAALFHYQGISSTLSLDYLVTSAGDTLSGFIKSHTKHTIKFRKLGDASFKTYGTDDIQQFYTHQEAKSYVSLTLATERQPIFAWKKEEGPISLYVYYKKSAGYRGPHPGQRGGAVGPSVAAIQYLYLQKDKQSLISLPSNLNEEHTKDTLQKLLTDEPTLASEVQIQQKINENTIDQLVKWYNQNKKTI